MGNSEELQRMAQSIETFLIRRALKKNSRPYTELGEAIVWALERLVCLIETDEQLQRMDKRINGIKEALGVPY